MDDLQRTEWDSGLAYPPFFKGLDSLFITTFAHEKSLPARPADRVIHIFSRCGCAPCGFLSAGARANVHLLTPSTLAA